MKDLSIIFLNLRFLKQQSGADINSSCCPSHELVDPSREGDPSKAKRLTINLIFSNSVRYNCAVANLNVNKNRYELETRTQICFGILFKLSRNRCVTSFALGNSYTFQESFSLLLSCMLIFH